MSWRPVEQRPLLARALSQIQSARVLLDAAGGAPEIAEPLDLATDRLKRLLAEFG